MLEVKEFEIGGYLVPDFHLGTGKFARLWMEILPVPNTKKGEGHKIAKQIEILLTSPCSHTELRSTDNFLVVEKVEQNFYNKHFEKPTIKQIIEKRAIELGAVQHEDLKFFEIDINSKLDLIDFRKRKLLEIFLGFCKWNKVIFNYYGLGPVEQERLTTYVLKQLDLGKTAIGFDNLAYISDRRDHENILNISVKRLTE